MNTVRPVGPASIIPASFATAAATNNRIADTELLSDSSTIEQLFNGEVLVTSDVDEITEDAIWNDIQSRLADFSTSSSYPMTASEHAPMPYSWVNEQPELSSESASDLFKQGMEWFRQGNVSQAIHCFEQVLRLDASLSESWKMLGLCHAENEEDYKAVACLHNAVHHDPYNMDALLALGATYVNEMRGGDALRCIRNWMTHHPQLQHVWRAAAGAESEGHSLDAVKNQLLQAKEWLATQSTPRSETLAQVHVLLGILYNVSEEFSSAVECFRSASTAFPDDYSVWNKVLDYLISRLCDDWEHRWVHPWPIVVIRWKRSTPT